MPFHYLKLHFTFINYRLKLFLQVSRTCPVLTATYALLGHKCSSFPSPVLTATYIVLGHKYGSTQIRKYSFPVALPKQAEKGHKLIHSLSVYSSSIIGDVLECFSASKQYIITLVPARLLGLT